MDCHICQRGIHKFGLCLNFFAAMLIGFLILFIFQNNFGVSQRAEKPASEILILNISISPEPEEIPDEEGEKFIPSEERVEKALYLRKFHNTRHHFCFK